MTMAVPICVEPTSNPPIPQLKPPNLSESSPFLDYYSEISQSQPNLNAQTTRNGKAACDTMSSF
jgi:hypothetical protein